jgi:hypothetical protein
MIPLGLRNNAPSTETYSYDDLGIMNFSTIMCDFSRWSLHNEFHELSNINAITIKAFTQIYSQRKCRMCVGVEKIGIHTHTPTS